MKTFCDFFWYSQWNSTRISTRTLLIILLENSFSSRISHGALLFVQFRTRHQNSFKYSFRDLSRSYSEFPFSIKNSQGIFEGFLLNFPCTLPRTPSGISLRVLSGALCWITCKIPPATLLRIQGFPPAFFHGFIQVLLLLWLYINKDTLPDELAFMSSFRYF